MFKTQSKGNSLELKCIAKFIELGHECSIPYGNSALYDFIADVNGKLLRIQCKNAYQPMRSYSKSIDYNSFQISTTRQTTNTKRTKKFSYNKEDIDFFMTIFNDCFYLVPVEECNTVKIIRIGSSQRNLSNMNIAENYLFENVLRSIII